MTTYVFRQELGPLKAIDFVGNRNQSNLDKIFYIVEITLAILCPSKKMKTSRQLASTHTIINHVFVILGCHLLMCKMYS